MSTKFIFHLLAIMMSIFVAAQAEKEEVDEGALLNYQDGEKKILNSDDLHTLCSDLIWNSEKNLGDDFGKRNNNGFNPWGGKRNFNPWGGKRNFNPWGGKRSSFVDQQSLEDLSQICFQLLVFSTEKRNAGGFNPWAGKRGSQSSRTPKNDETVPRKFNPWGGK